jgi:hypothetical protein
MRRTASILLLSALGSSACGLRHAARYEGSEEPSLVRADELEEVVALPEGYDRLGRVSATCTRREREGAIEGEWLSDLDCSESRLRAVIREKAAHAGGELLVGLACRSSGQRSVTISCRADVARPSADTLASRVLARRESASPPEPAPSAAEAWRIRVHFTPNPGVPQRAATHADAVREVPYLPVSHVKLGDVITKCSEGCSVEAVRGGVLIAASRVGATDVVGVQCAARGDGWLCTGTAAAYEVEPEIERAY